MKTYLNESTVDLSDTNRGVVFFNANQLIDTANEKFSLMMGMTRSEMPGLNMRQHIHADDLAATATMVDQFLNKEIETLVLTQRIFRKDGSMFWSYSTLHSFYNDKDDLIYWVGT